MRHFKLDDDSVVVVIGSGAGGGTMARELTQRGIKVVCLEAGPLLSHIDDFVNDEVTMFNKLSWLDKRSASGNWNMAGSAMPSWTVKAVGGTSIHWAGTCLRMREHELKARSSYGEVAGAALADWPITLRELAPFYSRAESKMGVTGTHGIPLLPGNNNFKVFEAGALKLGYRSVSTGTMAINSQPRDGRAPCLQLGFCFSGCKMGAKWSTLYAELPQASATGRFELRPRCQAVAIEHDDGERVSAVVYADAEGRLQRQKARAVVLAANAIETARLLLHSSSARFPQGLANRSGLVGRHYMRHVFGFTYAWFDKPVHFHRGTTCAGNIEEENGHDPSRGFVAGYHLQTIAQHPVGMARAIAAARGHGAPVAAGMARYDHIAGQMIVGEDMPVADNRITLHASEKDRFGVPIPNVHYDDHPNNVAMRRHAHARQAALYQAVGATDMIQVGPPPATHNMGTARMSDNRERGVVNRWGRAHDLRNLFVADGSSFVTSSAANPTLTIVALAIRQAEHIAHAMARHEL
jgi:choline dehydrogenase-like flavoprotein